VIWPKSVAALPSCAGNSGSAAALNAVGLSA
jgi:hypothetical protein